MVRVRWNRRESSVGLGPNRVRGCCYGLTYRNQVKRSTGQSLSGESQRARSSGQLGLWASASSDVFQNELDALRTAIEQYGTAFTDLIVGISVGSEDLYRISVQGIANESGQIGRAHV